MNDRHPPDPRFPADPTADFSYAPYGTQPAMNPSPYEQAVQEPYGYDPYAGQAQQYPGAPDPAYGPDPSYGYAAPSPTGSPYDTFPQQPGYSADPYGVGPATSWDTYGGQHPYPAGDLGYQGVPGDSYGDTYGHGYGGYGYDTTQWGPETGTYATGGGATGDWSTGEWTNGTWSQGANWSTSTSDWSTGAWSHTAGTDGYGAYTGATGATGVWPHPDAATFGDGHTFAAGTGEVPGPATPFPDPGAQPGYPTPQTSYDTTTGLGNAGEWYLGDTGTDWQTPHWTAQPAPEGAPHHPEAFGADPLTAGFDAHGPGAPYAAATTHSTGAWSTDAWATGGWDNSAWQQHVEAPETGSWHTSPEWSAYPQWETPEPNIAHPGEAFSEHPDPATEFARSLADTGDLPATETAAFDAFGANSAGANSAHDEGITPADGPYDPFDPYASFAEDAEADDEADNEPAETEAATPHGRRRPLKQRRSALLTVAVPSVAVVGVAGAAAATVLGGSDDPEPATQAAPDTANTEASTANKKLDTQLADVSADADDFAGRASRTQERIDLKERQEAERKRKEREAARKEAMRPKFAIPVKDHTLSAYYGQAGVNWMSVHTGIDFPVSYGTPVMAASDGTVSTKYDLSYGNMAIVTAEDGTETWYCHLSSTKIRSGEVKAGDTIAYSGSSGNVTGPHLHFEVHPGGGSAVDPLPWLQGKGLSIS